jgi:acyl-coenzyme A thioesterase PaaI-like protein
VSNAAPDPEALFPVSPAPPGPSADEVARWRRLAEPVDPRLDPTWLNDRSTFQGNFVHGMLNPAGLHVQYHLERAGADSDPPPPDPDPLFGVRVVGDWTADEVHMGFPGIAHGGLLAAILDDVIGRCAALRHRWVVTGRLDVRYRAGAPVGVRLRVEGWLTRYQRRLVAGSARILLPDGRVACEADGTYLPIQGELEQQMLASWPGFAEYLGRDDVS